MNRGFTESPPHERLLRLFPVDGSLCALCGSLRRSGKAEESNPGGSLSGSCCSAHPAGSGDVHGVCGWHGRIPERQQNSAAHGEDDAALMSSTFAAHAKTSQDVCKEFSLLVKLCNEGSI